MAKVKVTIDIEDCKFCRGGLTIHNFNEPMKNDSNIHMRAVYCTGCGMRGPWSESEYEAAKNWNKVMETLDGSILSKMRGTLCDG